MFSFAVLQLRLAPDAFWRLSVSEWRALVNAASPQAMTMRDLTALIDRYGG